MNGHKPDSEKTIGDWVAEAVPLSIDWPALLVALATTVRRLHASHAHALAMGADPLTLSDADVALRTAARRLAGAALAFAEAQGPADEPPWAEGGVSVRNDNDKRGLPTDVGHLTLDRMVKRRVRKRISKVVRRLNFRLDDLELFASTASRLADIDAHDKIASDAAQLADAEARDAAIYERIQAIEAQLDRLTNGVGE